MSDFERKSVEPKSEFPTLGKSFPLDRNRDGAFPLVDRVTAT